MTTRSTSTTRFALAIAALLLVGACSSNTDAPAGTLPTVTTTAAPVTVTAPAVTAAADTVTVTGPAVTLPGPTSTEEAPAVTVTVTEAAGEDRGGTSAASNPEATQGDVLAALERLPVKGRAPKTGYDRSQFGQAWTDDVTVSGGHNGCDTRNDVLRRDLDDLVVKDGTNGCVALTGTLPDPFTGDDLPFERGTDSGSQIHIDHIVSLSNAWQTGAQQLTPEVRQDLANDPLNLWAVSGRTNQQKGDGDAATWLPPNKSVRCDLVAHQVAVKAKYGLWVTEPEADAIARVLSDCPGHPLPTAAQWAVPNTH